MKLKIILILTILITSVYFLKGQEKDCTVEPVELPKNKKAVVIDVRTPAEYKSGHIKDAMLIEVTSSDFKERIQDLDKDQEYYVYCRSGKRSARAQRIMQDEGFKTVCNVEGGILKMKEENIPLVK